MSETYTKEQVIELIRSGVETHSFYEWYSDGGRLDQYLRGDDNAPTIDRIEKDIASIFRVR